MTEQTPTNTDRIFEAALSTQLSLAPGLGDVHATVNSGVATLTGNVQEEVDIKRAVMIAQAVEGLSEVREELKVTAPGESGQDGYFDPVEGISKPPASEEAAVDFTPVR